MRFGVFAIAFAIALTGCGAAGGNSPNLPQPSTPAMVPTSFVFLAPRLQNTNRIVENLTANVRSVKIVLVSVNGDSGAAASIANAVADITPTACPCTVQGPFVPPGNDLFSITTYNGSGGTGSAISTASEAYSITAGIASTKTITLNGVPAMLAISGIPSATAGTPFSAPLVVTAYDADHNVILGAYASPIMVAVRDTTGAVSVNTSGADNPPTATLLSSGDAATITYNGLALTPVPITASSSSAPTTSAIFAPAIQPISYSGPMNGALPEVDLYAASGAGSNATVTASEPGFSGSSYGKAFNASVSPSCTTIATVSPTVGTVFVVSAAPSPAVGSCNVSISDAFGQSISFAITYSTTSIGIH